MSAIDELRDLRHDLHFVLKFPGECSEGVHCRGEFQPCNREAVAVRIDPQECMPYPVCTYHARGTMVPLADLLAAVSPCNTHIHDDRTQE